MKAEFIHGFIWGMATVVWLLTFCQWLAGCMSKDIKKVINDAFKDSPSKPTAQGD